MDTKSIITIVGFLLTLGGIIWGALKISYQLGELRQRYTETDKSIAEHLKNPGVHVNEQLQARLNQEWQKFMDDTRTSLNEITKELYKGRHHE